MLPVIELITMQFTNTSMVELSLGTVALIASSLIILNEKITFSKFIIIYCCLAFYSILGIYNDNEPLHIAVVFAQYVFLGVIIIRAKREQVETILISLLNANHIFFVLIASLSLLNMLVNGNMLPLVVQNLGLEIIINYVIIGSLIRKSAYKYAVIYIIFSIVVLFTSPSLKGAIQVKFFVLNIFFFLLLYIFRGKSRFYIWQDRISVKLFNSLLLILFLIFLVTAYATALELLASYFNRGNSGSVRMHVNYVMIEKLTESIPSLIFGFGFGASGQPIDISGSIGRELETVAHSGIIILFYELGIFGVGIILFSTFVIMFKEYSKSKVGTGTRVLTSSMTVLVIFYVVWNLIIISGIPNGEPFWFYSAGFIVVKFILLSKIISETRYGS